MRGRSLAAPLVLAFTVACGGGSNGTAPAATPAPGAAPPSSADGIPRFEYDATFPKMPLPNQWILGEVGGVGVDAQGHVWVIQRPWTVTDRELAAVTGQALCCKPAPPVIEFDQAGNVVQSWPALQPFTAAAGTPAGQGNEVGPSGATLWEAGPGPYGQWGRREHTVLVDHNGFVWVSNDDSHVIYKFTREGKHVLTIGKPGMTNGSNDTALLGRPAGLVVDPQTN